MESGKENLMEISQDQALRLEGLISLIMCQSALQQDINTKASNLIREKISSAA